MQNWQACVNDALPGEVLWLNPPGRDPTPWIEKCMVSANYLERNVKIVVLLPVRFAKWYQRAYRRCRTVGLKERVQFMGAPAPYPKDCWLLVFDQYETNGFELWSWKS